MKAREFVGPPCPRGDAASPKARNWTLSPESLAAWMTGRDARDRSSLLFRTTGFTARDRLLLIQATQTGLPSSAARELADALDLSNKALAQTLAISPTTLTRRKRCGRLLPRESERVARLAGLFDATTDLMGGDRQAATDWLKSPIEILDGESPLVHAHTECGAREVEDLIGRLRYGVFS